MFSSFVTITFKTTKNCPIAILQNINMKKKNIIIGGVSFSAPTIKKKTQTAKTPPRTVKPSLDEKSI